MKFSDLSTKPASRAARYAVRIANAEEFAVLVHRGSVPKEKLAAMLTEAEASSPRTVITKEEGGL